MTTVTRAQRVFVGVSKIALIHFVDSFAQLADLRLEHGHKHIRDIHTVLCCMQTLRGFHSLA